jgi:hypothetical protein
MSGKFTTLNTYSPTLVVNGATILRKFQNRIFAVFCLLFLIASGVTVQANTSKTQFFRGVETDNSAWFANPLPTGLVSDTNGITASLFSSKRFTTSLDIYLQDNSAIPMREDTGKQYPTEQFRSISADQNQQRKLKVEPLGGVTVTAPLLQSVNPGANFTVNLMVSDTTGEGVLGYEFNLLYNQAVILPQATPCEVIGTISSGRTAVCNAGTPGLLRVVVFGAMPLSGSGILLSLNFTAVGMAGNISQLTFQNFVFNVVNFPDIPEISYCYF